MKGQRKRKQPNKSKTDRTHILQERRLVPRKLQVTYNTRGFLKKYRTQNYGKMVMGNIQIQSLGQSKSGK